MSTSFSFDYLPERWRVLVGLCCSLVKASSHVLLQVITLGSNGQIRELLHASTVVGVLYTSSIGILKGAMQRGVRGERPLYFVTLDSILP